MMSSVLGFFFERGGGHRSSSPFPWVGSGVKRPAINGWVLRTIPGNPALTFTN